MHWPTENLPIQIALTLICHKEPAQQKPSKADADRHTKSTAVPFSGVVGSAVPTTWGVTCSGGLDVVNGLTEIEMQQWHRIGEQSVFVFPDAERQMGVLT